MLHRTTSAAEKSPQSLAIMKRTADLINYGTNELYIMMKSGNCNEYYRLLYYADAVALPSAGQIAGSPVHEPVYMGAAAKCMRTGLEQARDARAMQR
jgi:hypothetical protein